LLQAEEHRRERNLVGLHLRQRRADLRIESRGLLRVEGGEMTRYQLRIGQLDDPDGVIDCRRERELDGAHDRLRVLRAGDRQCSPRFEPLAIGPFDRLRLIHRDAGPLVLNRVRPGRGGRALCGEGFRSARRLPERRLSREKHQR